MVVGQGVSDRRGGLPNNLARLGHPLVLAAAILLLTFAAYAPVRHAGFIWDDDYNVTENTNLRDWGGLLRMWTDPTANQQYYPLTHTSFWVEYHLWGLDPHGYHLVNVALHTASVLVLWRILLFLGVPGAWLASAIFALHPVQVESVAWVTERKNTLSGLFFLAAALSGIRFAGIAGDPAAGAPDPVMRRWRWYALYFGFFVCALFAKTTTCLLPVLLLLIVWWKKGRVTLREVFSQIPLAVVGAAAGLHTAWLERHHVGAVGTVFSHTFAEKILIAGRALWFYPGKLLNPTDLCFIYPQWRIESADAASYLYPAAALATLGGLWALRDRIGRGPLAAVLYYAIMIFPALGFFNLYFMRYSYVQDHFQYLASIGPIALFAAGVAGACGAAARPHQERGREPAGSRAAAGFPAAVAIIVLLPLGVATWRQAGTYRNDEAIWRSTLAGNPESWLAHNNLGVIFYRRGQVAAALGEYRAALRINPDYCETRNNLGCLLLDQGNARAAIEHLREALRLCPPAADILYNLGLAAMQQGDDREAEAWYRKALQAAPGLKDAHRNLAYVLIRQGRRGEAAPHLAALSEQP